MINQRRPVMAVVCLVVCLCATMLTASAQLTQATLKGNVVDANGNGVASAPVVARNDSTGETRTATTDERGYFTIPTIPTGVYTITVRADGFKSYEERSVKLSVGQTTELEVRLEVGEVHETVEITAESSVTPVKTDARLSDTLYQNQVANLPLPQRDIFLLPKLSAGATFIPGAALSTKVNSSPVVTVNGNRYRGNNYVLDGVVDTNPNNTGEPAIVPSVESVEEVQVQTGNFSAEYGRGNGSVVNLQTKSGTNAFHGTIWEYHRDAALNARNFFARQRAPQVFNQFGGNLGGPIKADKTFFFGSFESTHNAVGNTVSLVAETPEFRDYVFETAPDSVAARLYSAFPAPTPLPGANGAKYLDQKDFVTPDGRTIPAVGRTATILDDLVRSDQYLGRVDHTLTNKDKITARFIAEHQSDHGGTSNSLATLGKAVRGSRGPFQGFFTDTVVSYVHVFDRAVNDARASLLTISTTRGNEDAVIPDITISGITAPFGDVFPATTRLRTTELRDTLSLERGAHSIRVGGEFRQIFKGIQIGPATAGSFFFPSLAAFAADQPARQTLTVEPGTGIPTGYPRFFTIHELGLFAQDDWRIVPRLSVSLGVRYDYFGSAQEREGRLSSIVFGEGDTFQERLANASLTRVDKLYDAEKLNFSPRIGVTYDPWGDGRTVVRTGFSMAYQPHHGQSIAGARALPPDALQGVIVPAAHIGTRILYDIPVPFNPEFARELNPQGGVVSRPGEPPIRITGFVVNPDIKTQYSENWFLNVQQAVGAGWVVEAGYVGTHGVNLERIDDVNRFAGDLLDGREDRINPNFGPLLFVTNGVSSDYQAMTVEVRRDYVRGLQLRANYRWSKWLDTQSDTSTGQFADNSEPGKGAQNIDCLRCERGPSLFDIPHRFSASAVWSLPKVGDGWLLAVTRDWQVSGILTAQSGRPFSVWNGAQFTAGGDYNADGGGGAVGGGYYDRPNAPAPGAVDTHFDRSDFLNGLFDPSVFPKPTPGTDGSLGRNTFRGPRYVSFDLGVARSFYVLGERQITVRVDAFNALNNVNLYLPNTDLSLALQPDGSFSKTSTFGKSTQAFEPRVLQASVRFSF
jgi:hypothetical protein